MNKKVYIEGNYLFVENQITGAINSGQANSVFIRRTSASSKDFIISGTDAGSDLTVTIGQLNKKNGTSYSLSEFVSFYTTLTTGNKNGLSTFNTENISDSTNKRFVTDAEKTAITHLNRSILDAISEAFTTSLKTAYDSVVSWISTHGSNILSHLSSTSNPHNVTASQVGLGTLTYNNSTGRVEVTDAIFGQVSPTPILILVQSTGVTLSAGSNWYFGNTPTFPTTVIANREFKSPYNGKITGASIRSHAVSVAGDRTITVSIRINNTTDYLVQAVTSSSANREFINFALNTSGIPIKTSDNIAIKVVASGGTTDSTNILFGGYLIVQ